MSDKKELIARELEAALCTFTADGYAEEVGFDAGPAGIWAEYYGEEGETAERYKITFAIEEKSN